MVAGQSTRRNGSQNCCMPLEHQVARSPKIYACMDMLDLKLSDWLMLHMCRIVLNNLAIFILEAVIRIQLVSIATAKFSLNVCDPEGTRLRDGCKTPLCLRQFMMHSCTQSRKMPSKLAHYVAAVQWLDQECSMVKPHALRVAPCKNALCICGGSCHSLNRLRVYVSPLCIIYRLRPLSLAASTVLPELWPV